VNKPEARSTVATPEELVSLFNSPPPYLRLFMLLYLQCGLRRSETLRVTPRSWDPEAHTVTIEVKGGRKRVAQLTPDAENLLRAIDPVTIDPDKPFLWALKGKKVTLGALHRAWLRHKRACEVNDELTAHDLRRTAATILYGATKDLRVPQQLLGHKNLSSTLEYLAPLAPDEARRYAELLRFDKFKSEVKQ